jgi:hypothetical protein
MSSLAVSLLGIDTQEEKRRKQQQASAQARAELERGLPPASVATDAPLSVTSDMRVASTSALEKLRLFRQSIATGGASTNPYAAVAAAPLQQSAEFNTTQRPWQQPQHETHRRDNREPPSLPAVTFASSSSSAAAALRSRQQTSSYDRRDERRSPVKSALNPSPASQKLIHSEDISQLHGPHFNEHQRHYQQTVAQPPAVVTSAVSSATDGEDGAASEVEVDDHADFVVDNPSNISGECSRIEKDKDNDDSDNDSVATSSDSEVDESDEIGSKKHANTDSGSLQTARAVEPQSLLKVTDNSPVVQSNSPAPVPQRLVAGDVVEQLPALQTTAEPSLPSVPEYTPTTKRSPSPPQSRMPTNRSDHQLKQLNTAHRIDVEDEPGEVNLSGSWKEFSSASRFPQYSVPDIHIHHHFPVSSPQLQSTAPMYNNDRAAPQLARQTAPIASNNDNYYRQSGNSEYYEDLLKPKRRVLLADGNVSMRESIDFSGLTLQVRVKACHLSTLILTLLFLFREFTTLPESIK